MLCFIFSFFSIFNCPKMGGNRYHTDVERAGNSPDLNSIENLWAQMKDSVAEKQP